MLRVTERLQDRMRCVPLVQSPRQIDGHFRLADRTGIQPRIGQRLSALGRNLVSREDQQPAAGPDECSQLCGIIRRHVADVRQHDGIERGEVGQRSLRRERQHGWSERGFR